MSSGATDGSSSPAIQAARSLVCIAQASAMLMPAIFDDLAPSLSRVPSQAGQVVKVTARSTKARMCGWSESLSLDRKDFWILGISPSYVRLTPSTLTLVGSRYRKSCISFLVNFAIGLSGSRKPDSAYTRTVQKLSDFQPGMVNAPSARDLESS